MPNIFGKPIKAELLEARIAGIEKSVKVQATEGAQSDLLIESYLTGVPISENGTTNTYRTYASQTAAIYRKYNGRDELGCWQTRAVIDTRTSFIAGEGISIQCENEDTREWINDFLRCNRLKGTKFTDMVKTGEMEGRVLLYLKPGKETPRVVRHVTREQGGNDFTVELTDVSDLDSISKISIKKGQSTEDLQTKYFKFVKLGGDPGRVNETTTRTGVVLFEIENYDRSKNGMRVNNHLFSRATPFFKTKDQKTADALNASIMKLGWKMGQAFAGDADFSVVVPQVGAMENLKSEMTQNAKAISAITGIPVHWLGHTDLMSNRATAEELYDVIANATAQERIAWSEAIYDIIIKAQEMRNDTGADNGELLVDRDFTVVIPVMSYARFESLINALSKAYNDGAICLGTYRNYIPGVDPVQEQMAQDEADESEVEEMKSEVENLRRSKKDMEEMNPQRLGMPGMTE